MHYVKLLALICALCSMPYTQSIKIDLTNDGPNALYVFSKNRYPQYLTPIVSEEILKKLDAEHIKPGKKEDVGNRTELNQFAIYEQRPDGMYVKILELNQRKIDRNTFKITLSELKKSSFNKSAF